MKEKVSTKQEGQDLLNKDEWKDLQFVQFNHDETYHREISRLSVQDRMKHMTLHFAKYAGLLALDLDRIQYERVLTDSFIIAVSSANILNIDIGANLTTEHISSQSNISFSRGLSIAAGKMAAACEKLDHLEAVPFRESLTVSILDILVLTTNEMYSLNLKPKTLVSQRLAPIKQKSIFYDHL